MRKFLLLLLLLAAPLAAKNDQTLFLTWRDDPTTTMVITWITKEKDKDSQVHYRPKNGSEWQQAYGSYKHVPFDEPYLVHKVELKELQPDTIYRFHFGKKSDYYQFRTMPKELSEQIRFVAGGDAYNRSLKRFELMCRQAAKENPRFAIIGGDIAYSASKKDEEEDWDKWHTFFESWSDSMRDGDGCLIPLLATIGNHEVSGSFGRSQKDALLYFLFFEKSFYELGFGDYLHLTFLDSDHTQAIKGAQTNWLRAVLSRTRYYDHRFVIYHVGAYPSSNKMDFHVSKKVRKFWVPLFEKYKVHACFESHDHAYKRTFPLIKGKKNSNGVVYFGDGSWGVKPRKPDNNRPYLAHATETQQVLVVKLSKEGRKFWAVDPNGQMIDYFEQS